jgi:hypothetical protein
MYFQYLPQLICHGVHTGLFYAIKLVFDHKIPARAQVFRSSSEFPISVEFHRVRVGSQVSKELRSPPWLGKLQASRRLATFNNSVPDFQPITSQIHKISPCLPTNSANISIQLACSLLWMIIQKEQNVSLGVQFFAS